MSIICGQTIIYFIHLILYLFFSLILIFYTNLFSIFNFNYLFLDLYKVLQRKMINILNNTEDELRSPSSSNQTRYSNFIKNTYCLTPIVNTPPSMKTQYDMCLCTIY